MTRVEEVRSSATGLDPWHELPPPQALARLRKAARLSQEQVASLGGTTRLTVHRYENGLVKRSRALASPEFLRVVHALYVAAAQQAARRRTQEPMEAFAS